MKRILFLIIAGILTMSCGLMSTFAPPTNTPQPISIFTASPVSPTLMPKSESIIFPEVSDKKISENPESVVLLEEISLNEIPAFKDSKNMVFDLQNKKVAVLKYGVVEIWGFEDGELHLVHSLENPAKNAYMVAFSTTGNKIIVPWSDESSSPYTTMLQLWDTNSWTSVDIGSIRKDYVSVSFSPDENQLAVSGSPLVDKEGTIELWDTHTGELIKILPPLHINDGLASDASIVMVYSPDGTKIASTYSEPASPGIELWDINKGKRIFFLDGVGGTPNIVFSPDGRFLASTMDVGNNVGQRHMILWDANTGKQIKDVQINTLSYLLQPDEMAFSPDGKQLATASEGVINLLDMDMLNIRQKLESTSSEVKHLSQVEYLLDGRLLVSVGSGKIQFWGIPSTSSVPPTTETPLSTSNNFLRFDGLYESAEQDYLKYLRFYNDGTVLAATVDSSATLEQISVWFNKSGEHNSVGQYEIQDSTIKFTTTSKNGKVDYVGVINGEELILDTYSHINGNKNTFTYHFVEVSNMQP